MFFLQISKDDLYKLFELRRILVNESRKNRRRNITPSGIGLRAISNFLSVVFSIHAPSLREQVKKCYKVHIKHERDVLNNDEVRNQYPKKISFWCFSPAFG